MTEDKLVEKYSYIVDIILNRYITSNKTFVNDVDDFRQVGLIELWKAIKKCKQKEVKNCKGYLYVAVRNKIIKEIKRYEKLNKIELGDTISLNQKAYRTDWDIEYQDLIGKEDEIIDVNGFIEDLTNEEIKVINSAKLTNSISGACRISGMSRRKVLHNIKKTKGKLNKNVLQ